MQCKFIPKRYSISKLKKQSPQWMNNAIELGKKRINYIRHIIKTELGDNMAKYSNMRQKVSQMAI